MKKLCRLIPILLIVVFVFSACAEQTETHKVDGLSITLPNDFKSNNELNDEQDAVFVSGNALVTVLSESFNQLGVDDSFTEEDYAELVCLANEVKTTVQSRDGRYYFVYDSTVDGDDFRYLAVIFKGPDSFYMVQFCTFASDFENALDTFWGYADTVVID